jgi:hypothetical protein
MNLFTILANYAASNALVKAFLAAIATVSAGATYTTPTDVITIGKVRYDVSLNVAIHKD